MWWFYLTSLADCLGHCSSCDAQIRININIWFVFCKESELINTHIQYQYSLSFPNIGQQFCIDKYIVHTWATFRDFETNTFIIHGLFLFTGNVTQSACVIYEVGWVKSTFISVSLIELSAMGKDVAYLALRATESMGVSMIWWGHIQFSFQPNWQ